MKIKANVHKETNPIPFVERFPWLQISEHALRKYDRIKVCPHSAIAKRSDFNGQVNSSMVTHVEIAKSRRIQSQCQINRKSLVRSFHVELSSTNFNRSRSFPVHVNSPLTATVDDDGFVLNRLIRHYFTRIRFTGAIQFFRFEVDSNLSS